MNWRSPSSINLSTEIVGSLSAAPSAACPNIWIGKPPDAIHAIWAAPLPFSNLAVIARARESGNDGSGYFVHHDLVGDAAQRRLLLNRPNRFLVQDGSHCGSFDHRPGDVDFLRDRQALNPRGNVDGLAEIILPLVEHHGEARTFMDADLDHQIISPTLGIELVHRGTHPQARDNG